MSIIKRLGLKNVTENINTLKSAKDKRYILSGNWLSKNILFGDKAKFRFLLSNEVRLNGWVTITLMRIRDNFFDEELLSQEIRITNRTMEMDFLMSEDLIDYLDIKDIREKRIEILL